MTLALKIAAFLGLRGFIALGLGLALALAGLHIRTLNAQLEDARETIAAQLDWQTGIVDVVRSASNNPDVDTTTAADQVEELGIIRILLKNAIEQRLQLAFGHIVLRRLIVLRALSYSIAPVRWNPLKKGANLERT